MTSRCQSPSKIMTLLHPILLLRCFKHMKKRERHTFSTIQILPLEEICFHMLQTCIGAVAEETASAHCNSIILNVKEHPVFQNMIES